MKAIIVTKEFSSVESIQLECSEISPPEINSQIDCLVRVVSSGINSSDVGGVLGYFKHAKWPRIPGRDFAGIVVKGPEMLIGKRVLGSGGDLGLNIDGSHAEYIVVPKDAVVELPSTLSLEDAGTLGVPFITAFYSLVVRANLTKNDRVLVLGANGQVGLAAMQICAWQDAQCIGVVRNHEQAKVLSQQDMLIINGSLDQKNIDPEYLANQVAEATKGRGVTIILNSLGNLLLPTLYTLLDERGGKILTISAKPGLRETQLPGTQSTFDLFEHYRSDSNVTFNYPQSKKNITLVGVNTASQDATQCAQYLKAMMEGFESGQLKPSPIYANEIFSFDQISAAYKLTRTGSQGKVVVGISPEFNPKNIQTLIAQFNENLAPQQIKLLSHSLNKVIASKAAPLNPSETKNDKSTQERTSEVKFTS